MARHSELSRKWYLVTALSAATIALVVMIGNWSLLPNASYRELVHCIALGALGAGFSLIARLTQIDMDYAAGWLLHSLEAASRVVAGAIGAYVMLLAVQAGIILPDLKASQAALYLLCFAAGSSERLVPNLIRSMEGKVSKHRGKGGDKGAAGAKPADRSDSDDKPDSPADAEDPTANEPPPNADPKSEAPPPSS